jgi:hypothetical protein
MEHVYLAFVKRSTSVWSPVKYHAGHSSQPSQNLPLFQDESGMTSYVKGKNLEKDSPCRIYIFSLLFKLVPSFLAHIEGVISSLAQELLKLKERASPVIRLVRQPHFKRWFRIEYKQTFGVSIHPIPVRNQPPRGRITKPSQGLS